jgi:hypothetical protein
MISSFRGDGAIVSTSCRLMDRADIAVVQWARERPDLPALPMAVFGRLADDDRAPRRERAAPAVRAYAAATSQHIGLTSGHSPAGAI